eukprot:7767642-Ditylum_brightwellii.AAC.1
MLKSRWTGYALCFLLGTSSLTSSVDSFAVSKGRNSPSTFARPLPSSSSSSSSSSSCLFAEGDKEEEEGSQYANSEVYDAKSQTLLDAYKAEHLSSVSDPCAYWSKLAKEYLTWYHPFDKGLHGSLEEGN